ncbi:MAG TPA: hypothetical protein VF407_22575, partial [Polyangiaceae bacterium]
IRIFRCKLARTLAEPEKSTKWLKTWAFALVPLVGLVELGAHVAQARGVTPDSDWLAARDAVKSAAKPEDLVTFAPRWVDPVGREQFGGDLATLEREAYGDVSRFPRAFEVSIRGQHSEDLSTWKKVDEKTFGKITLTTLTNPSYVPTKVDLVSHLDPERASVTHGDDAAACNFVPGGNAMTGNLGFGPAIPGRRFECGGTRVGVSVVADMDYRPHRCIYAPPASGPLTITFKDVAFGEVLHGNHGLYVEAERGFNGAPVTITFAVGDKRIGRAEHHDGESWKGFEFSTSELAGQTADLTATIASGGSRRMYCFEAVTR